MADAAMPEPAPVNPHGETSDDYRTMTLIAWALVLAGVFTGIAMFAAVVVAYMKRGDAPAPWKSHLDRVVRTFWWWLLLATIGTILAFILVGFVVLAFVQVWLAVIGVIGLFRASENRPA